MEELEFPNRITVELTNDCNVSCTFCNRQKIKMNIGYMDEGLYHKIIDEASMHTPIKLVPFFRGEPLLHPQFIEFMAYAKSKGIGPIQVASNGLMLDDVMQEKIIEAGVDFISFSLDTLDPDIYKCSRALGNLEVSQKNVEHFSLMCKRRKEKGLTAPQIQVSTIDIDEYRASQKDFIEHWRNIVDIVRVYEQHDEFGRFVKPEVNEKLSFLSMRHPCRKVFTDMIIYYDGRLSLCNYDWNEQRDFGNINHMSLEEAWKSKEYKNIRRKHLDKDFGDEICKECNHWKIDYVEGGFLGKSYRRIH